MLFLHVLLLLFHVLSFISIIFFLLEPLAGRLDGEVSAAGGGAAPEAGAEAWEADPRGAPIPSG